MKKSINWFLIAVLTLILVNCSTKTEEEDNSALVYYLITEKNYSADISTRELGYSINEMHRTLYNSLIAGNSTFVTNILLSSGGIKGDCSLGGSVVLTGSTSTSSSNSSTKLDLKFTFTGCKQTVTDKTMSTTLTLDGVSSNVGTISSSGGNDYRITSSALKLTGTQSNSNYILGTPIEHKNTCEMTITILNGLSGSICGTSFTNQITNTN